MIVDTDVLIWYSKKHQKAIDLIHRLDTFFISVVTYMEIVQGVRNKKELRQVQIESHSELFQLIRYSLNINLLQLINYF